MFMRRRSSTELVVTTQCLPRAAVIGVCLASCVVCVARPPRAICPRHRPWPPEWAAAVTTSHNPVSVSRVSPPVRAESRAWVVGRWAPCSASAHAALQAAGWRNGKIRWPRRPGLPAAHQRLSFLFFFLFACLCVARPPRAICPRHRPRPPEWAAAVTTSHDPVSVSRVSPPVRAGSRAWFIGHRAPCAATLQAAGRRDGKVR